MATLQFRRWRAVWNEESPLWNLVAAGGVAAFAAVAGYFAHHQQPVLDEGTYLYKGLLFARGVYRPLQPNGPWSNHMPLSFLIPGYVQKWFGPGLDVGRYFAISAAVVMLLGLWLLVRRLTDRRWAAAAVWAFVAMPTAARVYSLAISQPLVAAIFVWVLALMADERPARWQLALSGLLAGLMVMTRLNMAIAWGLVGLFVTWLWRRRSVWFWGASLVVVLGLHALYWPRIVWLWARWLPSWVHLPAQFSIDLSHAPQAAGASVSVWQRLRALSNAFMAWPLAWAGLFAGMAAGTATRPSPQAFPQRALEAGVVLAWALALLHGWASVGKSYCVDCFTPYNGFYAPLMVAVGAVGLHQAWENPPQRRVTQALAALLFAVLASSNFPALLDALSHTFQRLGFHAGEVFLRRIIAWPHFHVFPHLSMPEAGRVFWTLVLLVGFPGAAWLVRRRHFAPRRAELMGLAALALLSPLPLLSGAWRPYDCAPDVLAVHRQAAEALARAIPPEATVYWAAYPPTVLLRTRGIRVFPQQLNDHYNFRNGGDPQILASWGYWNPTLARQWLAQADVVITDEHVLLDGPPPPFEAAGFAIRQEISLVPECLGRQGKLEIMLRSKP